MAMDHSDLVAEFPVIEKMTPAERIQLARERRALQLLRYREREKVEEFGGGQNGGGGGGQQQQKWSNNVFINDRRIRAVFKQSIIILEATSRSDVDEVRRLLASGSDPNAHNEDGLTPLHQCAIDNNEEMLKIFLQFGADINARDTELWTPLHAAACCGLVGIVKLLIDNGAALLAVNADGNMPYDICDDDNTLDYIESEMAKRGITQEDIDQERLQPERQMLADMQELKQRGGNLEYRDEHGATPLHVSSANGYYTCAQFLLDNGVSTLVRDDDGWQPVHAAACWAQADILELLSAFGADINARTTTGDTPLDLCEDEAVRAVIVSLQMEAQRRRLLSFARDSRRMSKRRKPTSKFESPSPAGPQDSHLVATRGAIRRLSIRDRAGVTLARLEARREAALMRSWSFEDASSKQQGDLLTPDDSNEAKSDSEQTPVIGGARNGGASVHLVGSSSKSSAAAGPVHINSIAVLVDNASTAKDQQQNNSPTSTQESLTQQQQQQKLHKISNDERKPKQGGGSTKRRGNSKNAAERSVTSDGESGISLLLGNGGGSSATAETIGGGAGAQTDAEKKTKQQALTLSDLKKQRSEDSRKSSIGSGIGGRNSKNKAPRNSSPENNNKSGRYRRSSTDRVLQAPAQQQRNRRRKVGGLRCCSIS